MNRRFERILLATEHTEFDSGAERVAFDVAKTCGLTLSAVLPVISNPEYEIVAPQLAEMAEREASGKIEILREFARSKGVNLEIRARRGAEPYLEIVQEASERQADLIITRRRGKRSFLPNLLVGEMVSKVVKHAPCSVLFVPRAGQLWKNNVLAALDNSGSARHVARSAARIAAQCGLPLTLLAVIAQDAPDLRAQSQATLEQAAAVAAEYGLQAECRIGVGKPFEQILASAKALAADLIVVGRHGESHVLHAPFGGTTQKVVGLSENAVLVSRDEV